MDTSTNQRAAADPNPESDTALVPVEGSAPPLPPPPKDQPAQTRAVPCPAGDNPEVKGWKKFLMVVGIIGGFNLYIVPGFFGIRTYRRWKRGETPSPTGWIVWGGVYLAGIVFYLIATALLINSGNL